MSPLMARACRAGEFLVLRANRTSRRSRGMSPNETEKGRERLFSAQPKSNAPINLQACKRDLEERLFYRRRSSPRFYTAKTQNGHSTPPARQRYRFCCLRQIHRHRQGAAEVALDQLARDALAQKICPTEFTEGRFVLGVPPALLIAPASERKGSSMSPFTDAGMSS